MSREYMQLKELFEKGILTRQEYETKIKQIQMAKAKVQVWLACQDKPSQDMRGIIQSKYLDETKTNY